MTTADNRSLGELFADLSRESSTLLRQEMALAKAELSKKASEAGRQAAMLAVGGLVAYAGFLTLIAFVVLALSEVLDPWISALLVGAVVTGIGAFLVMSGIERLKQMSPKPDQTVQSLKEDAEWLKNRAS
jgi:small-conductance mechanosensitive channel